jgi:hypothetical protein
MAEVLRGPAGPVTRHIQERAFIVREAARAKAPVKSGCLRSSIVVRYEDHVGGVAARIVADTTACSPDRKSYALFVHNGTKPHVIQGNPTLAFFWPNGPDGAGMYYFGSVNHPGTKANPFLADALPLAVV